MRRTTFIGLAGESGSGKDTLAQQYFVPLGFTPVAFADEGKLRLVERGLATWEELFITKPEHVRSMMQRELTREREIKGEEYWNNVLVNRCRLLSLRTGLTQFVITDLRFKSEFDRVKREGGLVYLVDAPTRVANNGLTEEQRAHRSEAELRPWRHYMDGVIKNDPEHAGTQGEQIYSLLRKHGFIAEMTDDDHVVRRCC